MKIIEIGYIIIPLENIDYVKATYQGNNCGSIFLKTGKEIWVDNREDWKKLEAALKE